MVRAARQEQGFTQEQLGKQIGTSRFTINRIEAGAIDVTPALAEQLEQVLHLPELRQLVAQRDRMAPPEDTGRDAVVSRLLGATGLRRLRIVLADGLNVYQHLFRWVDGDSRLRSEDTEIVVPTVRRERELFGAGSPLLGHIEYQLKRILDLKKSDHYAAGSLRLYESDDVVGSMVVAATRNGAEGALWPAIAVRGGLDDSIAADMPVAVSVERQAIAHLDDHVDGLIRDREPLRSNEALCRVVPEEKHGPIFTRYFTVGEDQEEDVDESEGFAVALVLVVALCPRKSYGVAHRVITYMRSKSRQDRRRSLFANTVEDIDIQRARAIELGTRSDERRSTRAALAAVLDINDYLESRSKVIPDAAFQFAAAREMKMFDLDLEPGRFRPVRLPAGLQLIQKPASAGRKRAAIVPRLFVVELQAEPSELAMLEAKADVDAVGKLDLTEDPELNDFLAEARDSGYLEALLTREHIADH